MSTSAELDRRRLRDGAVATFRALPYDDPVSLALIERVQQEYVQRYGGPDDSPLDPAEFRPPDGQFVVGYDNGRPVAMGGWRLSETARAELGFQGRVVELRRMYVIPESRGRGLARSVLDHLEMTAADAGADWMVLETGSPQPEAVALYRSSGYQPIAAFGHYATSARSIHLGKRLTLAP